MVRRFLLINQGLIPAIFNFFINGAIAWYLTQSLLSLPLWGAQSIAADLLATAFLLPLISCLIASPLVAAEVRKGKFSPEVLQQFARWSLPVWSLLLRSLLIGGIILLLCAAPFIGIWHLVGPHELAIPVFLWVKASFAAVIAAISGVLMGRWALTVAARQQLSETESALALREGV